MSRMSPGTADALRLVLGDPEVQRRYLDKVVKPAGSGCWFWTGAISANGHGRFWISANPLAPGRGFVVIAHRFGYGLAHGWEALAAAEVLAHRCDNPLCQNPDDVVPRTNAENRREWAARRHRLAGPLTDLRGARGRARAVRDALVAGVSIETVLADGVRPVERDQLSLWD